MPDRRYTLKPAPQRAPVFRVDYAGALNEEQLRVAQAGEGPILVIAGAGSGKTRTLIYRLSYLIECGVPAGSILLMTFTNRAARQMLRRSEELLGNGVRQVLGGTFHHVANLLLRRNAEVLGFGPNFGILDREDAKDLLDSVAQESGVRPAEKRFPKGDVLASILGYAVDTQSPVEESLARKYPQFLELAPTLREIFHRYAERKRDSNVMDFNDLLLYWKILLVEHPPVRDEVTSRFRHLLVDEYQDVNRLQADIVDLMAAPHRNLLVVGDDAQSIYSFRGASYESILGFPERYPDAQRYTLTTNYRSTPQILKLANMSIARNTRGFPKELRAIRDGGPQPAVVSCHDVYQQAEFVAQRLLELRDEGIPLREMAVLYRTHYQSLEVQLELTRRNIPYSVRSGVRFFEQAHIKDVIATLRLLHNPRDEMAWKRILKLSPGIGAVTAEKVWLMVKERRDPLAALGEKDVLGALPRRAQEPAHKIHDLFAHLQGIGTEHPAELISAVLRQGYDRHLAATYDNAQSRVEDIEHLSSFALSYSDLEEFLAEMSLLASFSAENVVLGGEPDEMVVLSSVHQAKGLEWRAVFVVWLADGRFPHAPALRDPQGEEEERRLFYVACTRAKDDLYLTFPLVHHSYDRHQVLLSRSRFVDELGAHDLPYERWELVAAPSQAALPAAETRASDEGDEDDDDLNW